jgi:hypothetical protein
MTANALLTEKKQPFEKYLPPLKRKSNVNHKITTTMRNSTGCILSQNMPGRVKTGEKTAFVF